MYEPAQATCNSICAFARAITPLISSIVPTRERMRYAAPCCTRYSIVSGAKYNSRATFSSQRTMRKLPLGYRTTTSPRGISPCLIMRLGSRSVHLLASPMRDERQESKIVAKMDMPSSRHIDSPRRRIDKVELRKRTTGSGATVFNLMG